MSERNTLSGMASGAFVSMRNPPTISAIPTRYGEITFRSRTEARWAFYFDWLSIRWEYEAEGYVLPDGQKYLPDFWLPQFDVFFEVKGTDEFDSAVIHAAAELTGKDVLVSIGSPIVLMEFHGSGIPPTTSLERFFADGGWDNQYAFSTCNHGHICCEYHGSRHGYRHCDREIHHDTPKLILNDDDTVDRHFRMASFAAGAEKFWDPNGWVNR